MSRFYRLKRSIIIKFINGFLCGTHYFRLKRRLLSLAGISCGDNTKVVGPIYVGNVSNVSFGDEVWVGTKFTVHGNGSVIIDDFVDIAPEVAILTGGHEISLDDNRRAGTGVIYKVHIGRGCWIGARSTILGNTKIGDGCVIAASSLVNNSVDTNTLCAGIPARHIRNL